jgi:hypothetical protein
MKQFGGFMRLVVRARLRSAAFGAVVSTAVIAGAVAAAGVPVAGSARAAQPDASPTTAAAPSPMLRSADPDPRDASVEAALKSLAVHVTKSSRPDALATAFRAYFNYDAARPGAVRKPYLYFVDLGLTNATPRGYVFDMRSLELVEGPFHVAHGTGSSSARNGAPTTFSNRPGSRASSLGLYLAQETYRFSGRANGRSYSSVGLRMHGESGEFNDAARRRGIVAHGAPYVTASDAGRSEGCPAMEQRRAQRLLPLIADGGVVFIYSPQDSRWLRSDPWVNYSE